MTDMRTTGTSLVATFRERGVQVLPGGTVTLSVDVRNLGSVVDRYRCEVLGIDASWVTVTPPTIELFPQRDAEDGRTRPDQPPSVGTFTVSLHPPRDPAAWAGQWPIGAIVTSEHDPSNRVVEETTITILPYGSLEASLHPTIVSGRLAASTIVELTNLGNRTEEVTIVASDPAERIDFRIDRTTIQLEACQHASVRIRVSEGGPDLVGGVDTRPFTVDVRSSSRDVPPPSLAGRFEKRAFLGTGFPVAIATVLALALGLVGVLGVIGVVGPKASPSIALPTGSDRAGNVNTPGVPFGRAGLATGLWAADGAPGL